MEDLMIPDAFMAMLQLFVHCSSQALLFLDLYIDWPKKKYCIVSNLSSVMHNVGYCTISITSAGGVTCDQPAEIFILSKGLVPCDLPKFLSENSCKMAFQGPLRRK
ncbi:hypothetical protein BT96DRAFT_427270 [Gymnopus androsaceus JB14]|uniref:Uncharacterized protein n=1 Tax=Gymnopus androsaceus JB14 TaxID=1447944 RepID=A0A6A4I379_9AGAR|nr:hypothetical protein BT96DRAFT_427270 [Gymnopus androsaceus JB14]